jgi:hypothetical protein
MGAGGDDRGPAGKRAPDRAHQVFGSIGRGRRISVTVGRQKVRIRGSRVRGALDWVGGARLIGRGGRQGLGGYVVTRAARRRRIRSRRMWSALGVTMASVTAIDSAMGSHGVSSDRLGDGDGVSVRGSGSP